MRKPLIAGNWKMNGSRASVDRLLQDLKQSSHDIQQIELAVFPPFVFLEQTQEILAGANISWGAQNVSAYANGAYTGEISASMLRDFGCRYVLIGHSERRIYYGEDDKIVAAKYLAAYQAGLMPIICVGETLDERNAGITEQVISCQLGAIFALPGGIESLHKAVIAYEPVWAIGTGVTAQPARAREVHAYIREVVSEYDKAVALKLRILYGGSMKRDNAADLLAMPDIDGGLIGGASLNAQEFLDIARLCNN